MIIMDAPSYQQILAEQYEETARNLLVYPNEYEDDEQVAEHETHAYDTQEVENPDEFNAFQPRHSLRNIIQPASTFDDKGTASIRYTKDVRTLVYNIDSRFRNAIAITSTTNTFPLQASSNFAFRLGKVIKNISSVKLTSFEVPNTFYTFSDARQNKSFTVTVGGTTKLITTNDGNYLQSGSDKLIDYTALATAYQAGLTFAFPAESFTVVYNTSSNRITIANTNSFTLSFSPVITLPSLGVTSTNRDNGVGYFLGFQQYQYTGSTSYTAEFCPQLIGDSYVYLSINDWNNVEHQNYNQSNFYVFVKILLTGGKNAVIIDTPVTNPTNKEYHFIQPANINLLQIKILDAFGKIIDLDGANISMTLEFNEVLNLALYEKLREL